MKIEELRIGNRINFKMPGTKKEVIINIRWFLSNETNTDLKYWAPIIIDKEILKRIICDFEIKLIENGGVMFFNKNFYNIIYLHQLQNLWYCLTDEELKIREDEAV